ncbi:MAG: GNAT family N-acetyltransferase [Micromonosporaceae bacterium]|nr:GNAT family N-acetyltransferase [Micromonosporaceae bacterium]
MILRTERLVLRRCQPSDVDDLLALHNDPEVMRYIDGGEPTPRAEIEQEQSFWGGDPILGRLAAHTPDGEFLGWFGLRTPDTDWIVGEQPGDAELGYRLRRAVWGRGLATEGARALVGYAFTELRVPRVIATTMAVNTASRRVMEKVGLRYLNTFHLQWPDPLPGTEHGEVLYGVTRAEWLRRDNG